MNQSALAIATQFFGYGWQPIPIQVGAKAPTMNNWQKFKTTTDELSKYFNGRPQNIGVLLGKPSNDLIDIDLDTPTARRAAPYFLPKTATFGRAGNPVSHYLYRCEISTKKFQDPLKVSSKDEAVRKDAMLVEIRSTGMQTVFPGSVHPSGEAVEWTTDAPIAPVEISAGELKTAVGKLAVSALIASYWRDGIRNELTMALAGSLIRHGFDEAETLHFIKAVCVAAQDEETEMRLGSARSTIKRFQAGEPTTGLPKLIELTDKKIVDALCKWLEIKPTDSAKTEQPINEKSSTEETEETEKKPRKTQATVLLELSEGLGFFHTPNEDCFAIVQVSEHRENLKLNTKAFRSWLARKHYEAEGQAPSAQSLQDVITALSGKALFDSPCFETHIRVAEHEGAIFIDLCNPEWQAVKITVQGWQIIESTEVPIKFRRSRGMLPLPSPEHGGSLQALKPFVNVKDGDFILVLAWLLCVLRPNKPFACFGMHGEQGSAKSTTQRVLRSLIDPNQSMLRSRPRDERDLMVTANNSWFIALDNLSGISAELSDGLCRLATGGGFSTRELYSDSDEILFNSMRPILFNGIEDLATRSDLLDRSLIINLPRITEEKRKTESEFWLDFENAKPAIIGALFDTVALALKNLPSVKLVAKPRMADFAEFAYAAFGDEFITRYEVSREAANEVALESSPVALAVQELLSSREKWEGSASELLAEFEKPNYTLFTGAKDFPKQANALSGKLKRAAPNLRAIGINFEPNSRKMNKRTILLTKIEKVCKTSSSSSSSSLTNKNGHENHDDLFSEIVTPEEKIVMDEIQPTGKSCSQCEQPVANYTDNCPHCGDFPAPF